MADAWSARFGELRAALHGARTPEAFGRVLQALQGGYEEDAGGAEGVLMPYAADALREWPDAARTLTLGEAEVEGMGCGAWLGLVRGMKVETPRGVEWIG